jgi:excisionase family DNA binding protein
MSNDDLLTVGEVAEKLGCSCALVRRWLNDKRMKGRKIGRGRGNSAGGGGWQGYWVVKRKNAVWPEPLAMGPTPGTKQKPQQKP